MGLPAIHSDLSKDESFLESDLEQLTKPELIRLVRSLQERIKTIKSADTHGHTQAPKDFEGISRIRPRSPSMDSFASRILNEDLSVEREKSLRYKAATALLVDQLLSKGDGRGLDAVFAVLNR